MSAVIQPLKQSIVALRIRPAATTNRPHREEEPEGCMQSA